MPAACDPQTLLTQANCGVTCLPIGTQRAVMITLLAKKAGVSADPSSLTVASAAYIGMLTDATSMACLINLACAWAAQSACDPATLAAEANCLINRLTFQEQNAIIIYELCQIAGGAGCDAASLLASGNVWALSQLGPSIQNAIMVYLLATITQANPSDPQSLVGAARCSGFCLPQGTLLAILVYLLCQVPR